MTGLETLTLGAFLWITGRELHWSNVRHLARVDRARDRIRASYTRDRSEWPWPDIDVEPGMPCTTCDGHGLVPWDNGERDPEKQEWGEEDCPDCEGTGVRSASVLEFPRRFTGSPTRLEIHHGTDGAA